MSDDYRGSRFFCVKCKAELDGNMRCMGCGADHSDRFVKCPSCGQLGVSGDAYCLRCGADLDADVAGVAAGPETEAPRASGPETAPDGGGPPNGHGAPFGGYREPDPEPDPEPGPEESFADDDYSLPPMPPRKGGGAAKGPEAPRKRQGAGYRNYESAASPYSMNRPIEDELYDDPDLRDGILSIMEVMRAPAYKEAPPSGKLKKRAPLLVAFALLLALAAAAAALNWEHVAGFLGHLFEYSPLAE